MNQIESTACENQGVGDWSTPWSCPWTWGENHTTWEGVEPNVGAAQLVSLFGTSKEVSVNFKAVCLDLFDCSCHFLFFFFCVSREKTYHFLFGVEFVRPNGGRQLPLQRWGVRDLSLFVLFRPTSWFNQPVETTKAWDFSLPRPWRFTPCPGMPGKCCRSIPWKELPNGCAGAEHSHERSIHHKRNC